MKFLCTSDCKDYDSLFVDKVIYENRLRLQTHAKKRGQSLTFFTNIDVDSWQCMLLVALLASNLYGVNELLTETC